MNLVELIPSYQFIGQSSELYFAASDGCTTLRHLRSGYIFLGVMGREEARALRTPLNMLDWELLIR